jgi:hypothetical protein
MRKITKISINYDQTCQITFRRGDSVYRTYTRSVDRAITLDNRLESGTVSGALVLDSHSLWHTSYLTKHVLFAYLDDLRESGAVNMFGAAPYLSTVFDISAHQAQLVLVDWMTHYG